MAMAEKGTLGRTFWTPNILCVTDVWVCTQTVNVFVTVWVRVRGCIHCRVSVCLRAASVNCLCMPVCVNMNEYGLPLVDTLMSPIIASNISVGLILTTNWKAYQPEASLSLLHIWLSWFAILSCVCVHTWSWKAVVKVDSIRKRTRSENWKVSTDHHQLENMMVAHLWLDIQYFKLPQITTLFS